MTSNLKQIPESPTTNLNSTSNNSNVNRHSDNIAFWSHVTSTLLHNKIINSNSRSKLLIIDSRDLTEYNKMHISNSVNIHANKIMYQQLKSDKISIRELLLRCSDLDMISNDSHELNIVVYDLKSEHTNQLDFEKSFTILLLKKLSLKYKSVSFLIGGFVHFNQMYPNLCESSSASSSLPTPIVSITSEQSPIVQDEDSTQKQSNLHLRPKQFKFNHSLSTYGIDLCPTSTNSISTTSSSTSSTSSLFSNEDSTNSILTKSNSNVSLKIPQPPSVNYLASPQDEAQPIREPTKILDFLYLGSQEDALSKSTIEALNITNVLNVSITCPKPDFISDAHFLRIPVNDGHAAKILPFFDIAFKFIEKCRKAKCKVLIHCLAGISRSPTLAIAYLMKHLNLKSDEAYRFVKDKRKTISPNFNFLGQLYEYEKQQLQLQQQQQQQNQLNKSESEELKESNEIKSVSLIETKVESPSLTYLKFEKKSKPLEQVSFSLSEQRKKQFIFNFSQQQHKQNSSSNAYSLLSPSQAFSSFNLNSPTIDNAATSLVTKSLTCNSLKDILTNSTNPSSQSTNSSFLLNKPNVVMRRPTNLVMTSNLTSSRVASAQTNALKRPSSILLGFNNNSTLSHSDSRTNELSTGNSLNRTLSNTSAGSASSTCSSCSNQSNCSNQSCSSCSLTTGILQKQFQQQIANNEQQQYQYQKKIKLSPIQDRIVLNSFVQETHDTQPKSKMSFVFTNNCLSTNNAPTSANLTSPLTPNSLINTNNILLSFNQKLAKQKCSISEESLKEELLVNQEEGENEENIEMNNSVFGQSASATAQSNKSSSSSSSSNKNSLHGSIETMIEVS